MSLSQTSVSLEAPPGTIQVLWTMQQGQPHQTMRLYNSQHSVKLQSTQVCPRHAALLPIIPPVANLCSSTGLASELSLRLSILLLSRAKCPMTSQALLFLISPPAWNTPWQPASQWLPKLHNPCPDADGRLKVPLSPNSTPQWFPKCQFRRISDLPPWQWKFLVRRKGLTATEERATLEVGRVWKHLSNPQWECLLFVRLWI